MSRKRMTIGILALAALVAGGAWIAGQFSEQARIKRAVAQGAKALEDENLADCLGIVSEDYGDALGWDKARIREGLGSLFAQFTEIKAEVSGLRVNLENDRATVKSEVRVKAKSEGTLVFLIGNLTNKEEAVLFWAKEEGRWRLTRVEGLGIRE